MTSASANVEHRLQEDLRLLQDASLADPVNFPWIWVWIGVSALLIAVLCWILLRRRPQVQPPSPVTVVVPPENALEALDQAWDEANEDRIIPTLERMSSILRRYLGRQLATDMSTLTTGELGQRCEVAREAGKTEEARRAVSGFASLQREFFEPADLVRFAGVPAKMTDLSRLHQEARHYLEECTRLAQVEPVVPPSAPGPAGSPVPEITAS